MNKDINVNGFSVLLFRIALSGIFILAGVSHIMHPDQVAGRINKAAFSGFAVFFGDPYILGLLSGYALLACGINFLAGIFVRYSALALLLLLIPITITIQMGNGIFHGTLWKNVALFGGLLFFIINDPQSYIISKSFKKTRS
ncbi:DoxX family membrane protein [Flavobacterium sp. MFBS3-15]|uniref:DoxX family protein n=1 Tax=Flavobacterium sp. MFBS3-15 TaxID=2989816 RepID=UPI002235AC38|nr:DoxX family membrane protein [Flavobacterium sp. MFBS3-15]MCW4468905.1 DoxX family membrane protein [Flavobacterium sp. MFBS3-15]